MQNLNRGRTLLPLLFCLTCLAACGTDRLQTQVQVEQILIPDELLSCGGMPIPGPPPYLDSDAASYIVALRSWGIGCSEKLGRIKALQKGK